jgi:hypothetical protein
MRFGKYVIFPICLMRNYVELRGEVDEILFTVVVKWSRVLSRNYDARIQYYGTLFVRSYIACMFQQ